MLKYTFAFFLVFSSLLSSTHGNAAIFCKQSANVQKSRNINQQKSNFIKTIERIRSEVKSIQVEDVGSKTDTDSKAFSRILKKIFSDEKIELNKYDYRYLANNHLEYKLVMTGLYLARFGEINHSFLKTFLSFVQTKQSRSHLWGNTSFKEKLKSIPRSIYNGPIRFLNPFFVLPKIKSSSDKIFEKQWKNPDQELSKEDLKILKNLDAEQDYVERNKFLKKHSYWVKFRKLLSAMFVTFTVINSGAGINHAVHLENTPIVSYESFANKPRYKLEKNQIRIMNENVPFPHLAIQIGDKVYSYGQTHMSVTSTFEYLQSKKIMDAKTDYLEKHPNKMTEETKKSFSSKVGGEALKFLTDDLLEMQNWPRSLEATTINLSDEAVRNLKRDLELNLAKRYRNNTLVLDCASMIVIALKNATNIKIPSIIDPSPSSVMMYLSSLNTLGLKNSENQSLIEESFILAIDSPEKENLHLYRDSYINIMEGKLFLNVFPIVLVHRLYLELRYGEENFQYWDPEVINVMREWQSEIDFDIHNGKWKTQFEYFEKKSLAPGSQEELKHFKKGLSQFVDFLTQKEYESIESADSSLWTLIKASYRIEYFKQWKEHLQNPENQRDFNFSADFEAILDGLENY